MSTLGSKLRHYWLVIQSRALGMEQLPWREAELSEGVGTLPAPTIGGSPIGPEPYAQYTRKCKRCALQEIVLAPQFMSHESIRLIHLSHRRHVIRVGTISIMSVSGR